MNSKSENLFCPLDRGMQQLMILLVTIYSKLDHADISADEIRRILKVFDA